MALSPKPSSSAPAPNDSVSAIAFLQSRFDAGDDADTLLKLADSLLQQGQIAAPVNPENVKAMVAYRDKGGKGAGFLPSALPGQELGTATPTSEAIAPVETPVGENPLVAGINAAVERFQSEPSLGLDPELRSYIENMGPLGRYLYAPVGDIAAAAYTPLASAGMGLLTGAGQLLENVGILPAVEDVTGVRQTPQNFAEQVAGIAEVAPLFFPLAPNIPAPEMRTVAPARLEQELAQLKVPDVPVNLGRISAPRIAEAAPVVAPPPLRATAPVKAAETLVNKPFARFTIDDTPITQTDVSSAAGATDTATTKPFARFTIEDTPFKPPVPPAATLKQEGPEALNVFAQQGQTEDLLKLPAHKRVSNFQADVGAALDELGFTRATERGGKPYPFQEFIVDHLNAGTLPNEVVAGLIQKHGLLNEAELRLALGASMESATRAARILNLNSQASRTVLRLVENNPELGIKLDSANRAANSLNSIGSFLRYIGRTRAGLLTGTIATAARNAWSASPIMPTYSMLTEVADAALRNARNVGRRVKGEELLVGPSVSDALYSYMDELARGLETAVHGATFNKLGRSAAQRRTDNLLLEIEKSFPTQNNDLFATYASDLAREYRNPKSVTGKLAKATDRFIEFANVGNQAVARWTKNAQFPAILRMEAKRNGVDLDALFDAGQVSTLDPKIVEDAVRLMQKRLFDEKPNGKLGKAFVTVMEHTTQPLGVTPFPNFAVSYFKYVAEQNPLAVVRFASKAERAKIAAGDHRAIGKIMAGLATTLAYLAAEDGEGEWYEIKDPNTGKQIDARAILSPHVPSMFAAYVIRKAMNNDLASVRADDALKVIGASNLRAGAGAYAVDSLVADLTGAGGSESKVRKVIDNWAKDYVPGFLRFFAQFKDVSGQFSEQDRLRRMPETTGQAVAAQLPGGAALYERVTGEAIPESQSITREATPSTVNPILRTLVGVTVPEDQNYLEQTISRAGLRPSDLYRNTGIADFDNLMREKLGEAADKYILPSMKENRDKIEKLSGPELRLKLKSVYERNRAAIRKEIYTEDPRLQLMLKFDGLPEDRRKLENEKALRNKGKTVTQMFAESEGKPLVWNERDIAKLPSGTEYMDIRDYKLKVKK